MQGAKPKRVVGAIEMQSAPEAAAQAIRDAIITGELKGGDRIIEQKWAGRLGIGQPTLREALKELEYQGLLTKVPQRGTYVSQLSPTDYQSILEVRIPLEAIAMGLTAERLTDRDEKELTTLVMNMASSTGADGNVSAFHDCDVAFHRRIWELAGNDFLRMTLEMITFRLFVFSVVGRWPTSPNAKAEHMAAVQQHLGILEGLKTRRAVEAQRAFVSHTVQYWNAHYGLRLAETVVPIVGSGCQSSKLDQL